MNMTGVKVKVKKKGRMMTPGNNQSFDPGLGMTKPKSKKRDENENDDEKVPKDSVNSIDNDNDNDNDNDVIFKATIHFD